MKLPCGIIKIGEQYALARVHGGNVQWMDRRFARISTGARGDMRWADLPPSEGENALGYVGKLNDRQAILVGKGPSLGRWLEDPVGAGLSEDAVLVTINEAYCVAPRAPDFGFCLDPPTFSRILEQKVQFPETVWVSPAFVLAHHDVRPLLEGVKVARWTLGDFGTRPGMSTAGAALRWLYVAGVRRVHMVGFDGWDDEKTTDYADCVQDLVGNPPPPTFEKVNRDIRTALDATGIEPVWYHRSISGQATEATWSVLEASESVGVSVERPDAKHPS